MMYLLLIGLIINFVGIVLIAISFGGTVEGAQQMDSQGRKIYLAALLHPRVFLFGLSILGLGFLLQIISEVAAFFSHLSLKCIVTRFSARHRLSPVCTENSVLIDYVTESPNVSGDDLRTSRVAIDKKIAATGPRCDQVRRARSLTRGHGAPQQRGGNLRVKSPARTARAIPP
jgi:hypothetical protein